MTIVRRWKSGSLLWICGALGVLCCVVPRAVADDRSSKREVEQQLTLGKAFLQRREYAAARDALQAVLKLNPRHREAQRLLKDLGRQATTERDQALKIALDVAREKAKGETAKDTEAQAQLRTARDRQLKLLYNKGQTLYSQGSYKEAVETLRQMTIIDPKHPLVSAAEKLIAKAELKETQRQARLRTELASTPATRLSELEEMLTVKRLEQETLLKFARLSMQQQNYDRAIEAYQRVLAQDPDNEKAQKLLQQAEGGKLKLEEAHVARQVALDEQRMLNDVTRSELLKQEPGASGAAAYQMGGSGESPMDVSGRLAQPISFDFQQVAFTDVLDFLADAANVSIIPSPRFDLKEKRVSLRVDKAPLEMALKYLVKNLGLAYRLEDGVVLIASEEEFESEPLETRVFFLRSGLGPFALETSAVQPGKTPEMTPIKALIDQAITQPAGSKLVVDERSGSLIMTNTGENLRKVEQLLSRLDITPVQVMIETRFIEVNLTEVEQRGFETILSEGYDLTKKVDPKNLTSKGPGHQLSSGGGFRFPAISREGEGLNITLQSVLDEPRFEAVLHLLEESQKSKTLSAPRLTTLNNQTATIKVVDEFRYPTRYEVSLVQFDVNGDGDFDDAGETEFVNVPQDFQKRDIGILLNVTPSVGKDLKTITLVLAPEVSSAASTFRNLGGGVVVPSFTSSQLTTSVVINDTQTVMLGGLMKDTMTDSLTKVPVLGDLPVFGNLFKQTDRSQVRKNLLIFVTARILAPRGDVI